MQLSTSLFTALLACSPAASLLAQGVPGGGGTVDTHGFVSVTGTVDANINATVPGDADADAVAGAALGTKAFSADAGMSAASLNGVSEARGRATVVDSSTSSRAFLGMSFDIGGTGPNAARTLNFAASETAQFEEVDLGSWAGLPTWVGMPTWAGCFEVKGNVRCRISGRAYAHNIPFPALPGVDIHAEIKVSGHGVVLQRDENDPAGGVTANLHDVELPFSAELDMTVDIDCNGTRRVRGGMQARVEFTPTEITWVVGGIPVPVWVAI